MEYFTLADCFSLKILVTMINLPPVDYDTRWKVLIEKNPVAFIRRFFPDIHPLIDYSHKPRFLKQEISKILAAKGRKGAMKADVVFEVRLLGGQLRFLYVHVEVQLSAVRNFGVKMFRPFYWIYDTYGLEIAATAIFLGKSVPKKHDHFEYSFGKTKLRYDFPVVVVRDLDASELKKSDNIFDFALLACKYVLETSGEENVHNRYELTLDLVSFILDNAQGIGLETEDVKSLVSFILNVLILPPKYDYRLTNTLLQKYNKTDKKMNNHYTDRDRRFAAAMLEGLYGVSIPELLKAKKEAEAAKLLQMKKFEAQMRRVEAEKKKAEAEKKKAEADRVKSILSLHGEFNISPEKIAKILNLEVKYVQAVLSKKRKTKASKQHAN